MPVAELPVRLHSRRSIAADATDDTVLVERLRAGDDRAFEAIFKRHHVPLLSYCRHMLGDQDEAEDALQQAFIKAHRALLGGTAPRQPRPWLYAIARNCCLSAIAARRPTTSLEDHTPALAGLSDEVRQREDLRELLAGIGRLPEDQRSALLLAELEDLNHRAIATIVGCPVSKVKALVYQARFALIADRDALGTPCQDIREQLSVARGGELRRGPLRRHLKLCSGCRDFQLALSAQRQSLAAVLPVLPSAGLAAAILGHGAAHAAAAATSVGGTGAGLAPAGGAAGTASAGVTATATTATGGTGIAATGTAATAAVGAGAGGGTSVGALVGGGLLTKLAVGGTVLALAATGAVAAHNRSAHGAIPHRATRLLVDLRSAVSYSAAGHRSVAAYTASSSGPPSSLGVGSPTRLALVGGTGPAGSASLGPSTEPSGLGGAEPLATLTGTNPPSLVLPSIPGQPAAGQPAGKTGQSADNPSRRSNARARHRRAVRHRRRLRKAPRRARLHKTLRHHHRVVTPKPPAAPTPPAAPAPVRAPHRKARPTSIPSTAGAPAGTPTTGSTHPGAGGQHNHKPVSTGTTGTGAGAGTGTTSTGTGKTGAGQVGGSGSGKGGGSAGSAPSKTKAGGGTETSSTGVVAGNTSGNGAATEQSDTASGTSTTTSATTTSSPSTPGHSKKHLVEEGQLPNF